MISVLIADDHKIFRRGLKQVIEDTPDIRVVQEAENGHEVTEKVGTCDVDVVILDISMPGPNGLDVLKQLQADYPRLPVLMLSMHPEEQYALRVIKAGAAGYLTKDMDEADIISAVRKAAKGGKYITPTLAEKLAFAVQTDPEQKNWETLSDREFQVMQMIAGGKSTGDIAKELFLGVSTISTYRSRILEKTGLKNNAEITHYAIKHGLLDG